MSEKNKTMTGEAIRELQVYEIDSVSGGTGVKKPGWTDPNPDPVHNPKSPGWTDPNPQPVR